MLMLDWPLDEITAGETVEAPLPPTIVRLAALIVWLASENIAASFAEK